MSGFPEEQEPAIPEPAALRKHSRNWEFLGEAAKFTVIAVIMWIAFVMLKKKLSTLDWEAFLAEWRNFPMRRIWLASGLTILNYIILTGYDLIAVRYLKKDLSLKKVMTGAIVGYSISNLFGWILGGNAVRYRMYSSWGFSLREIVAFVSILSMTFWLGLFLLAGVAFVLLPIHIPREFAEELPVSQQTLGWVFLGAVAAYLLACALWRKPIRWGDDSFALPPLGLSTCQLLVSACDFALASAVLYVLLPSETTNFSTVLVAYLAAMIVVVTVHVPGGVGILENILLALILTDDKQNASVVCALVYFRIIYYFAPAAVGGVLFAWNELKPNKRK
jgi:uncharacterized membrane protein YbhN (UPF0104 family)